MLGKLTAEEYLDSISKRCKRLTASDMLEAMERELERARTGWSHYLFDGRHAPYVDWSVPGALEYTVQGCDVGLEVVMRPGPFDREELSVHVEEGSLDVEAVHDEEDPRTKKMRHVRVSKHVPIPVEFDLDEVDARFEKDMLIVRIPKYVKPRRKVEIK